MTAPVVKNFEEKWHTKFAFKKGEFACHPSKWELITIDRAHVLLDLWKEGPHNAHRMLSSDPSQLLIGKDPFPDGSHRWTAVHQAAYHDAIISLKECLIYAHKYGFDILNVRNRDGYTPRELAKVYNKPQVTAYFENEHEEFMQKLKDECPKVRPSF